MKTALVYDWFSDGMRGGEKTFDAVYELFPSPIYTLLKSPKAIVGTSYEKAEFHTSFIQNLPFALTKYRNYFPLFPLAMEQFDLSAYDLILSSSHCAAKGVLTHSDQLHLCYCYTPVRYAWDLYHQYLSEANIRTGVKGRIAQFFLHYLRLWDTQSSHRVDAFGAISQFVAKRIKKTYGREAKTIYPPVATDYFIPEGPKENFYLAASRFVPYKKIDLIVEAFSKMPDKKLVVIGEGPDWEKVKSKASKNIELLGHQDNGSLRSHLQKAKAFVFGAVEDFGILPLEAQACGTPVIAYGKGAVRETVLKNQTGLFFDEQTPAALCDAVSEFEKKEEKFDSKKIRTHAERFGKGRFQSEFQKWVNEERERCTS